MVYVYAIINREKSKIYVGYTTNIEARIKRHNGELPTKKKSFTYRNGGLWELVHYEAFETRREAMAREQQLKTSRGRAYIKNMIQRSVRP